MHKPATTPQEWHSKTQARLSPDRHKGKAQSAEHKTQGTIQAIYTHHTTHSTGTGKQANRQASEAVRPARTQANKLETMQATKDKDQQTQAKNKADVRPISYILGGKFRFRLMCACMKKNKEIFSNKTETLAARIHTNIVGNLSLAPNVQTSGIFHGIFWKPRRFIALQLYRFTVLKSY